MNKIVYGIPKEESIAMQCALEHGLHAWMISWEYMCVHARNLIPTLSGNESMSLWNKLKVEILSDFKIQ